MIVFVTLSKTVVAQLLRLSFAILVWRGLLGPPPRSWRPFALHPPVILHVSMSHSTRFTNIRTGVKSPVHGGKACSDR